MSLADFPIRSFSGFNLATALGAIIGGSIDGHWIASKRAGCVDDMVNPAADHRRARRLAIIRFGSLRPPMLPPLCLRMPGEMPVGIGYADRPVTAGEEFPHGVRRHKGGSIGGRKCASNCSAWEIVWKGINMSQRSLVFAMPANASAGIEIEISHVEARRLIREYDLPNRREDDATNHDIGTWERRSNRRYFIYLHT